MCKFKARDKLRSGFQYENHIKNINGGGGLIHLEVQIDLRLIVEAYHEVGHQLEEVLPEAQEHVQVEVAHVHLAVNPRVVQVAHALEAVHVVEAEASVHARV